MCKKASIMRVVLIAALLLAGCSRLSASRQTPPQPGAGGNSAGNAQGTVQFSSIRMFSDSTGWALSDRDILRTADGGYSWAAVTPPGDWGASLGVTAELFDAERAWVAKSPRGTAKVVTLYTADGGQTWQKTELPQTNGGAPFSWGSFSFADNRHGWLMTIPDHGMNSSPGDLFATADGGVDWLHVVSVIGYEYTDGVSAKGGGLPFGGTIGFHDAATGWVAGSFTTTTSRLLYRTQDGGRTWRKQELKMPAGYADGELDIVAPPKFFSAGEGILTATYVPKSHEATAFATVLYMTRDGGQTWQSRTPLRPQGLVDFFSADDGWNWRSEPRDSGSKAPVQGKLYRTADGGATWAGIAPDQTLKHWLDQGLDVTEIDFIDRKTGWALLNSGEGQSIRLLKSADGGATWASVYPG